jgi:hypothetical protein
MIKLLLFSLFLTCTTNADSSFNKLRNVNANSSWDEILKSDLTPDFPMLIIGTSLVRINKLCVQGDNLQGPSFRCAIERGSGDNVSCEKYEDIIVSLPIAYQDKECLFPKGATSNCIKFKTVTKSHKLIYDIRVNKVTQSADNEQYEYKFTKRFDISACD